MTIEEHNLSVSKKGTLPALIARVPFLAIKEKILGKKYELSIAFVSSKEAKALNNTYRRKDYVPNTLSFSLTKTSGEIVLCLPAARKEHKKFEMNFPTYVTFLIIHSALHLKGYAHSATMEHREKQLLALFA